MKKIKRNRGISLLEMVIIIAIIIVISSVVSRNLMDFSGEQILNSTTADVVSILNKARSDTISSLNSISYGIHFESNRITVFSGDTYSSSSSTNKITNFNPAVAIPSTGGINITGGGSDIIFERLTGDTQGGTIKLQLISKPSRQNTITINKTGIVSSN